MNPFFDKQSASRLSLSPQRLQNVASLSQVIGLVDLVILPTNKPNSIAIAPANRGLISKDERQYYFMAGVVLTSARCLGLQVEWDSKNLFTLKE